MLRLAAPVGCVFQMKSRPGLDVSAGISGDFEFDDVVPDIVTMGKPMGNGHPLAAVVTRPEIAEALAAETGYFNTFGGNPVSCAAGLAVLDVIEVEGLQQNALVLGDYLRERFLELRINYPVLGEPHGAGLLLGVDVLNPDGSPDSDRARRIMNHMRQNRVLIGTTGPHSNVLKFRPPIVFNREHADTPAGFTDERPRRVCLATRFFVDKTLADKCFKINELACQIPPLVLSPNSARVWK